MEIVLIVVAMVIGGFWLLSSMASKERAERHAAAKLEREGDEAQSELFDATLVDDWPVVHKARERPNRSYFMMSADRSKLRLADVRLRPEWIVRGETIVDVRDVVSVELQQSSETIMKFDTTSVTKKSGALGRAAVGGALLGGVGAVVGAASAGSTTTGSMAGRSHPRKGPVYLVVGTTDMTTPMLKVKMNGQTDAENWLHRIRGSITLLSQA